MESLAIGTERLVHLDFKGGPLKIPFFEKFFPFIKEIGATGILIEWEDTFPYTKELIQVGGLSTSAQTTGAPYSIEEAKQLINLAEDCGLNVIPLVQTFGHMEFVLKHEAWRSLREVEAFPSSMCPSSSGTMTLVRSLLSQIISFHTNSQYIHIGADEVWHMGVCLNCVRRLESHKFGKASLYLDHVTEVAQYIKEKYPNLKIIIWDDMVRNIDANILQEYFIGNLVEPMIWHYNSSDTFQLGPDIWDKYSNVFKNIWTASAFKGSTSSCQILPINKYHISNHESWLTVLSSNAGKIIKFKGIALTGWSRFDHYATLCDLLPCAIPSLCLCLKTWLSGGYNTDIFVSTSKILGYTDSENVLPIEPPIRPAVLPSTLTFCGNQVLLGMEWFANIRAKYKSIIDSDQMHTWLNQWQVLNNYTNPMQIESILPVLNTLFSEITSLEAYVRINFEPFYYPPTIEELIGTLIVPINQHVRQLKCECETQIANGCRVRGEKRIN